MLERLIARWRAIRQLLTRRVVWDLFMVYLAIVNLGLILFDWTYLWLRPTYFRTLPLVARIYDPVKGIEPHPETEGYLGLTRALAERQAAGAAPSELEPTLARLRERSLEMLDDSPFERSGQERSLIRIVLGMRQTLEEEGSAVPGNGGPTEVFSQFWSLEPDPQRLAPRVAYFERDLEPLLAVNYHRAYDLDGELTDYFWMLDLPFLAIFAAEFFTRWLLAWRRSTYDRWFFFPIFNWYDLLGIVPIRQLRVFRLFRIVSLYVRLHRSDLTVIGDDPISRTVKYFSNIISEEISDMVTLRILNETQEELRDGTHKRIVRTVAESHRDALSRQLADQLRRLLTSSGVRAQAREFLDANLERAVDSAEALRRLPVPDRLLQPLVGTVGQAVFDAIADTLTATLSSEEGQESVRTMVSEAVDALVLEFTEGELESVVREISIEVIEHMKQTVSVRKWTLADQPRRQILTREVVD